MEYDNRALENQQLFDRYKDDRGGWELDARQDVDFYLGNHFSKSESQELASRNQADVPMDRISPAVERLKSMLTSRPPAFTVVPREDSDSDLAAVWRTIMDYVWKSADNADKRALDLILADKKYDAYADARADEEQSYMFATLAKLILPGIL